MKHPSHPVFVHFPLAFWVSATVCDLAGFYYTPVWQFGSWCLLAGCLMALLAVGSGLMQLPKIRRSAEIEKLLTLHIIAVSISYSFYVVSLALRMEGGQMQSPTVWAIACSTLAAISLAIAGWFGGTMVYGHGVGVATRPSKTV